MTKTALVETIRYLCDLETKLEIHMIDRIEKNFNFLDCIEDPATSRLINNNKISESIQSLIESLLKETIKLNQ